MCACWVTWVMSDFLWPYELQPTRLLCPWDSPARILECVAMPSSRGSSLPRDQTHVSYVSEHKDIQRMAPALAGGFFTTSASTHNSIHSFQLSTRIHRASRVYHLKINLFHCKFLESRNSCYSYLLLKSLGPLLACMRYFTNVRLNSLLFKKTQNEDEDI